MACASNTAIAILMVLATVNARNTTAQRNRRASDARAYMERSPTSSAINTAHVASKTVSTKFPLAAVTRNLASQEFNLQHGMDLKHVGSRSRGSMRTVKESDARNADGSGLNRRLEGWPLHVLAYSRGKERCRQFKGRHG